MKFFVYASFISLSMLSCGHNQPSMGVGGPELRNGKFADTPFNNDFFGSRDRMSIHKEKNNLLPNHDWERAWRVSFAAIDRRSENPAKEKQKIIRLRRKAGLTVWPFMLK